MFDILAIDWGSVRTGLALGDSTTFLIIPYNKNVLTSDLKDEISTIMDIYPIQEIVVGYPTNVVGGKTQVTEKIINYFDSLKTVSQCKLIFHNERYSTKDAFATLISMNSTAYSKTKSKKQQKKQKDNQSHSLNHLSASKILESYLEAGNKTKQTKSPASDYE